jgi:hypothetical protein
MSTFHLSPAREKNEERIFVGRGAVAAGGDPIAPILVT